MILLDHNTLDGKPIVRWEVWWRSPDGLHKTLDEALMSAMAAEMPPQLLKSVPVAIAEDGSYEERPYS